MHVSTGQKRKEKRKKFSIRIFVPPENLPVYIYARAKSPETKRKKYNLQIIKEIIIMKEMNALNMEALADVTGGEIRKVNNKSIG